jgi:hypothetical protein
MILDTCNPGMFIEIGLTNPVEREIRHLPFYVYIDKINLYRNE